jgi:hypothetical protein
VEKEEYVIEQNGRRNETSTRRGKQRVEKEECVIE